MLFDWWAKIYCFVNEFNKHYVEIDFFFVVYIEREKICWLLIIILTITRLQYVVLKNVLLGCI